MDSKQHLSQNTVTRMSEEELAAQLERLAQQTLQNDPTMKPVIDHNMNLILQAVQKKLSIK